jgi:hypothetical protein
MIRMIEVRKEESKEGQKKIKKKCKIGRRERV